MATAHQSPPNREVNGNPKLPEIKIIKRNQQSPNQDIQRVEKLPSIHIPSVPEAKTKTSTQLADFLDDPAGNFRGEPSAEAHFKVNILARDKAIQLLQQYNEIVANNDTLALRNVPPVKLSIRTYENKPKVERHLRKHQVFTEGISSISRRPDPSFMVPKESVMRANLPNSVIVAQKKNQFTFGIKQKTEKKSKDSETPKFKQIRMLGLDNLPAVDMSKYISREKIVQASVDYRNGVKGSYTKSPRKLDPIKFDGRRSRMTDNESRVGNSYEKSLKSQILTEKTVLTGLEHKMHVVSIGESFMNNKFLEVPSRRKGISPLPDTRKEDSVRFYSKDPSVYGVCALAPIRVGAPYQNLDDVHVKPARSLKGSRKMNRKQLKSNAKSDTGPIRIPTQLLEMSDPGNSDKYVETRLEIHSDSIPSYQKEVMFRKTTASPTESASTAITNHFNLPPPPPSYSSSTDIPGELVRNMTQIEEERSNLERERTNDEKNKTEVKDITSEFTSDITFARAREELPPTITTSNSVARRKTSSKGRQSRAKEAKVGSIINLGVLENERRPTMNFVREGIHLSIPTVEMDMMSEKRPPLRDSRSEFSDYTGNRRNNDSQATWYSTKSDARESQKLTVKNINPFDQMSAPKSEDIYTPEISITSELVGADGDVQLPVDYDGVQTEGDSLLRQSTEEEFKKFALSSKSLQFISPLKTIENAKRQ